MDDKTLTSASGGLDRKRFNELVGDIPPEESYLRELDRPTDSLITAGFTMSNFMPLVEASLAKPGFMGWFIEHGGPKDAPRKIKDFLFKEIFVSGSSEGPSAATAQPIKAKLVPCVHVQALKVEGDEHDLPYEEAKKRTRPRMFESAKLKADDLSFYKSWAGASFVRRSDLEFLYLYLTNELHGYNDVFFSGSFVDYGAMHNPQLRLEQIKLKEASGEPILDSSQAFALKVEPFVNDDNRGGSKRPVQGSAESLASSRSILDAGKTSLSQPTEHETKMAEQPLSPHDLPLSFMGMPCPPYWRVGSGDDT